MEAHTVEAGLWASHQAVPHGVLNLTATTDVLCRMPEVGAGRRMHQILAGVKNWAGFQEIAATLGPKDKGDLFELLTKHFMLLNPTYNTNLSDVWLLKEVPEKLRARLQLPEDDKGIDLIARTKSGGFWGDPVQVSHGKQELP